MELLLIRHGIAETREAFVVTGEDDSRRPLTKRGQERMQETAKGLLRVVSTIDVLASSSLLRAVQTAAIVSEAYGGIPVTTVPALQPDSPPQDFLAWLRRQHSAQLVVAVGHEPHLGLLATWLMTGQPESRIAFRKGGACLLEFGSRPEKASAVLQWALTPRQLRRLGG
jgi:phosphohistidine phosphatase